MKAFITSLQQQKHNQRLQCNQIMSVRVCIIRKRTQSINVCVCKLVFESLHAIDTFTKRKSVNKQRDKACKLDINRFLLDLDSLGFESFRFSILNCPSLLVPPTLPSKLQSLVSTFQVNFFNSFSVFCWNHGCFAVDCRCNIGFVSIPPFKLVQVCLQV